MITSGFQVALLLSVLLSIAGLSWWVAPRVRTVEGFFRGQEPGYAPGVWTLTLSQVTTWIFARSLMNAALLGYFYGIAGTLAYAVYYASFLTGWLIIDRLRFVHGYSNIQFFFSERFGRLGVLGYNLLVSLRLLSEVFANLLVVGIVFGAAGSGAYNLAILAVAAITLLYSLKGGLSASLKTDVQQMLLLMAVLLVLLVMLFSHSQFELPALVMSSPELASPGWILLVVALLQVISYPLHDPVMMDRGFLGDRDTTRKSFIQAFWISTAFILLFGLLGVFAGLHRLGDEEMMTTLQRLLGTPAIFLLGLALIVSAASTLDSTLSSASKLAIVDMGMGRVHPNRGRLVMLLFMLGGLFLVYFGTDDLYAAVAVSGTASLFLTPVIIFCIWMNRRVARWSFLVNFLFAVGGSAIYFLETSSYVNWIGSWSGVEHDYSKLLILTLLILSVGMISFWWGMQDE
ncbi:sodium:solute symporter family transporter [Marinospirillum sp.]|uniref:sodium:solute symporter family transporter n=1 Tax=Marinospirillum sp. TaxID=2183934 RepID=UPI00286FBE75|nr:sodium:proline symporter [Marinospirillum sp.]MDR9468964.1 sodium:proline symporter [Marinospirillum sp.]